MTSLFDTRRYLTNFDPKRTGNVFADVLIIGSGVAGSRAAIEAAPFGQVILMTKGKFEDSASSQAQGGIAAVVGPHDSFESHFEDTMRVGCQANSAEAVEILVREGPGCLEELLQWGLQLDREGDGFALTREGGHSINRVVHADGDQTGRELMRTLKERVRQAGNVRVFDHCFLIDFITVDGTCVGAVTFHSKYGHQLIWAKETILASGGCGQLWRETTNPAVATGDGLAAAYRAGASLWNMEFVQFHPTTLYVAGAGRELITEAVRGEGGFLVDRSGERFMSKYHPDGELAPRDVVSRAIHEELVATRSNCVYLDVRHMQRFESRFPHIAKLCRDFRIDVTRELIPIRPAAHYMIGGVHVDLDGRSCVEGLSCCGEASWTGVHGANRLASNSLLEGLVFGKRAGRASGERSASADAAASLRSIVSVNEPSNRTELDLADIRNSLRSVMWRNVGIVREGERLTETCDILNFWGHFTLDKTFDDPAGWEVQNQLTTARLVAMSALARKESIGVHHRLDADEGSAKDIYHLSLRCDPDGTRPTRIEPAKSARAIGE